MQKNHEKCEKTKRYNIVTTAAISNYLVSKPNYDMAKSFSENVLALEMKKTWILMNKPVYLGVSVVNQSNSNL